LKTTAYFREVRRRPDRASILDEWIELAMRQPVVEKRQTDGRIRRWDFIESEGRYYLRIILLADGETMHNAFFDRRFHP
jgi:hypothetical protein